MDPGLDDYLYGQGIGGVEWAEKALIPSQAGLLRRAGFLADPGLKRFRTGDCDDHLALQPRYFRGPSITRPKPGKK